MLWLKTCKACAVLGLAVALIACSDDKNDSGQPPAKSNLTLNITQQNAVDVFFAVEDVFSNMEEALDLESSQCLGVAEQLDSIVTGTHSGSITLTNCVINGASVSAQLNVAHSGSGVAMSYSISGNMTVVMGTETYTLSNLSASLTTSNSGFDLDFYVTVAGPDGSFEIDATQQVVLTDTGSSITGEITVTGAKNAKIRFDLNVDANNVAEIEVDEQGNGQFITVAVQ